MSTDIQPPRRSRSRLVTFVAVGLVVVTAACTDGPGRVTDAERVEPEDPSAPADPLPFLQIEPADTRDVPLAPVAGRPPEPEPVEVFGGEATLTGTVAHAGAPVSGATVQIERFEGVNAGSAQAASSESGSWSFTGVKGGRYRIRAWAGELRLSQAITLFLREDERREVALELVEPPPELGLDYEVVVASTPSPALVGEEVELRFVIERKLTADDEELLTAPVADTEVRLAGHEGWDVAVDTGRTDSLGALVLRATCRDADDSTFVLGIGDDETSVDAPRCEQGAPEASEPETVAFAVGQRFTPPFDGPLPAGAYRTSGVGCATSFERWVDGAWEDATARGRLLELDGPGRDFRAVGGSTACTYERVA